MAEVATSAVNVVVVTNVLAVMADPKLGLVVNFLAIGVVLVDGIVVEEMAIAGKTTVCHFLIGYHIFIDYVFRIGYQN